MYSFFIDRPVFAGMIALGVVVGGVLAALQLPVAQYPPLGLPRVVIETSYPGASIEDVEHAVASIIEQNLDGVTGLQYYESTSDNLGNLEIDATFAANTDPAIALAAVQDRIKQVESRLPQQVVQQGIDVSASSNSFLMQVSVTSTDGTRDSAELSDYLQRFVIPGLKRAPGVGAVNLWDANQALRIWLDPMKLREYGLSAADVNAAIAAQNSPVPSGALGGAPLVDDQQLTVPIVVKGQLDSTADFGRIVLKAQPDGSAVRLADVARIEIGRDDYGSWSRLNGRNAAGIGIRLSSTGNALETSNAVRERLASLDHTLPPGMAIQVTSDNGSFIRLAIWEVFATLGASIVLVFLVMWLFLRDLRCTLVPTIVIPVSLTGTFLALYVFGMSINVLTMSALVLAIGILVDDAIVVVESVHRVIEEDGLAPREATRVALSRIGGAIVGMSAVLTAVFVPMAFFPGVVGQILRQFAVTMLASMLVSSFMALSLAPALCAHLLGAPRSQREAGDACGLGGRLARGFAGAFAWIERRYRRMVRRLFAYRVPALGFYTLLCVSCVVAYRYLPDGFLPTEDQGELNVSIVLPGGATQNRTLAVLERVEAILRQQPDVANVTGIVGVGDSANGQNVATVLVEMADWSERRTDARALRDRLNLAFGKIPDGEVWAELPSSMQGIARSEGFTLRLEDRAGVGRPALVEARDALMKQAKASPLLTGLHGDDLPDAPRIELDVDRVKAYAMGVPFDRVAALLGNIFGSTYVDDFPQRGRMRRVIVQGDASARMTTNELLALTLPNASGAMVPLSSIAQYHWSSGPVMLTRYNGYASLDISGRAAEGVSGGGALREVERLAATLPQGIAFDWVGAARQQNDASRMTWLLFELSLLAVFMVLAALYESWTVPLAVLMVVPLGLSGAIGATLLRGFSNDVFFRVGIVTVIGLSAKNAVLVVQCARDLCARGVPLRQAVVDAACARFRPIVMTSAAFMLGVVPLVCAGGAGAESRRSIGTGVFGGMLSATSLGLLYAPLAFYVVMASSRALKRRRRSGRS